jgi:predicted nucleotidyltransferase
MSYDLQVLAENRDALPLEEVVAAFRQGLGDDLVAVVLFGSRARGEADEASDWDLLVIACHLPERTFKRYRWLKGMLPVAWRGQTAILAKTPEEFESYLTSFSDGYVAERLASLRRLIEKQGLRRERVQRDLVWRWQRFPGFDWSLEWEAAQ